MWISCSVLIPYRYVCASAYEGFTNGFFSLEGWAADPADDLFTSAGAKVNPQGALEKSQYVAQAALRHAPEVFVLMGLWRQRSG